ncbi:MAG: hypothetical protein JWM76_1808 [Pseudonocardiales bacterium]|nr:hypothetical protein [Pseudonocardiales bacterium]
MRTLTRRGLLGSGAALLAAAGGGAAGWFSTHPHQPHRAPPRRSVVLEAELTRERALLAQLDATVVSAPALAPQIAIVRADHLAHVDAITSLLTTAGVIVSSPGTATPTAPSAAAPPTPFVDLAALIAAETGAAAAAASASAQSAGAGAATLASISACESTHVAWLSR